MEEPIISNYKEGEIAKQGDSQEKKVHERAPVSHEEKVVQPNKMLYHGRHDRNDDPKNKEQTVLKETGESERSKPEVSIIEEPLKYSLDSKAGLLEYPERHQGTAQENDQGRQDKEETPLGAEEKLVYLEKMQHRQRQDQHDDSLNKNRLLLQESEGKEELNREEYEFGGSKLDKGLECSSDYKEKSIEHPVRQQGEKQIEEQQDDAVKAKYLVEQSVIDKTKSSETITELGAAFSVNNPGITSSDELGKFTGNQTDKRESILPKYKQGDDSQGKQMQDKASESREEKVVYPNKIKDHANVEKSALKEAGENKHPKSKVANIEESLKSSPDYEDDYQEDYQVKRIQETAVVDQKEQVVHPREIQNHDRENDSTNENPSALQGTGEKEERKGDGSERKEHFTCRNDFQESSLEQPEKQQVRDRKKLREGNTVNGEILLEQTVSDTTESLETIMEKDTSVSLNNQGETIYDNDDDSKEEIREKAIVGQEEKVVEEIQDKDRQDQCDVLTKKDLSPLLDTDENKEHKLKPSKIEAPLKSSPDHEEKLLECSERPQDDLAKEDHYQVKQEKEKGPLSHEQKNGHLDEMQDRDRHDQKVDPTNREPSVLHETAQNEEPKPEVSKTEEPLKSSPDHKESSLEYTEGQQEHVATEGDSQEKQVEEKGPLIHEEKNWNFDEIQYRNRHDQQVDPTNREPLLLEETGQNEEPKPEVSKTEEPLKSNPDHEESSLEYTKGQQEDVSTEGDSQEKQIKQNGPLSHEEKNGNFDEMQDGDRHDQKDDTKIKEPPVLGETNQNEDPKLQVSKIEESLKSSPDSQESSLEYTEGQQEEVATEGDSQEKQFEGKGPLSHEEKNGNFDEMQYRNRHDQQVDPTNKEPSPLEETGQNEEPTPEVTKLEEPLKSNPDHKERSLEYTEGQQEDVSTEGDSQDKQVEEKGPLSQEEKNGSLDEMQDRDRHDQQVGPTIKEPSVFEQTGKDEEPKPEVSKIEEPLKSSPDREESLLEYAEGKQEEVATEGDSQHKRVEEKAPLSDEEKNRNLDEMQYRDRHDQQVDPKIKEPSVLDETGQNEEPKPEVSKIKEPPKFSPDHEESSLKYTEGQKEEVATEGDSQETQVNERGPLSHGEKNGHLDEMQDGDRNDQKDDTTIKEPVVLEETDQNEDPKPQVSKIKESLKSSPDQEESSFRFTEGQQEKVATEGDSQEKQVNEKGPLGQEQTIVHFYEKPDRDRHHQQDDPTNKQPSVLYKTGQSEEPMPEMSKTENPLKLSRDHDESSLEWTERPQEDVAPEGHYQVKQLKEKGPLTHEEKNGHIDEMQDRDLHDLKDNPTIKEPSVLDETGQSKEPKPKMPMVEEPLKSSPDQEESSLEYSEGQQEEVATKSDSQAKQVKEKEPLSDEQTIVHLDEMPDRHRHDQKDDLTNNELSVLDETEQNKEPKPEVSMIEEPLKYSPDHEESSLEYSEGQQEEVATEGDSQEKQIKEKGPLSHEQTNGHLDEMQDRHRHDQKVVPTNKEPSLLQETGQNEQPKREVSKIEEPLKYSPDHEEYTEGQQEEVATEGDSQEKQVEEKGPLSHEEKNGNLDEMQYRDRHDQPVHPTVKDSSVFEETGENEERKPEVSEIEETLKSSSNYNENSFEHTERQQGVVASQDDSRGKREQEKAPISYEEKCINQEKIQDYGRHNQHDDRRNKNSEMQKTGENKELKREGSDLDDPVISNCDNEEMSLKHTERQQVQEKKELLQNEAVEVESLVEQPVTDQTESIQTIIEDDAVVIVNNQEITNSNELRISNGKQTDKKEPVLPKNKKDVVATQDDSQQVQGEAPVSHEEEVLHLRTIQDYDGHAMHGDPSNNAQSKSVLPETGESKQTTLEQYKIEERLKINPDYKESSLEYLERQEEAATQNDFEEKKVEEKVPLTYEERSLHPGEMQDHDRHIKPDNSKNKDQSVLQETSENEKPKLHASKIAEPLKSFSNNEDRTLECLERQQKEVATQDDSPVKQVQEKALVGHKEQVMHPDKMQDLDRQFQQNDFTSKNQSVLQGKEERKREGLERKEPLESSCNFEERLLENLEREQVKNEKKMQEDNAVNGGSVVEQADSDKTESLETINEEDAFVSLNNLVNASSDDDDFQEQQEQEISLVGHEEKVLEELLDKDLIQQHQYGDLTDKDLIVQPETSENQEPKLKATKIEEFDSQDKQVKEKGPSMHEQKIVHLDEVQDLDQHDQQDDPTQKEPPVLQEIGENEEARLEDSELEELKIKETLRSSCDYEEKSLENPDSNQVQQQKELQKDDIVGENVVEQEVIDKTESIETMIKDICFSASSRVTADSDEFDKTSSKQTNTTDPILSKCKENEVPLQGDCQDRPVQKEASVRHEANVEVHDGFYLQDDPADNNQPVVQMTNNNKKLKLKEPIKPSFDNEEWPEQREAPVNKKRKSAISLLWCWCCG